MLRDTDYVVDKLRWMEEQQIWPNGLRYLWTDAFGVALLVSLFDETGDEAYLDQAEAVVADVERVLGRKRGLRIGEAPDRDGQYFHYLAMWIYALTVLSDLRPRYRERALDVVREIHEPFVRPGVGVVWKMEEDLSSPYPGYGYGALDAFDGYVVYRLLDEEELRDEIQDMRELVESMYAELDITQDLGIGMMLWMAHFFPDEPWAKVQTRRCLETLDEVWIDPPGYFCRQPGHTRTKFAFTNYGVSVGLQAQGVRLDRVRRLNGFFDAYRSGDEYDVEAITHVMACSSHFPGRLLKERAAVRASEEVRTGDADRS